mgnify:CR=1 FL=1|jgi:hypothetical protein
MTSSREENSTANNNSNANALFGLGIATIGIIKKTLGFDKQTTFFSSQRARADFAHSTKDEPPDYLKCAITQDLYKDPVVLVQTGYTYEREAIARWLKTKRFGKQMTDPTTNVCVTCTDVVPNWQIRNAVEQWLVMKGYGASDYFEQATGSSRDLGDDDDDDDDDGLSNDNEDKKALTKKKKKTFTNTLPPPKYPLVRCASENPPAIGEPTDKFGVPIGGRNGRGNRNSNHSSLSRLARISETIRNALHRDVIVIFHALKRIALSSPRNLTIFLAFAGSSVGGILVAFLIVVQRILFVLTGKVSAAGLDSSALPLSSSSEEQVRVYINENAANSVATAIGNVLWWTFILTMMWFTQHNAIQEHQHLQVLRARAAQEAAENNQRRPGHRVWFPGQRHARFLHW